MATITGGCACGSVRYELAEAPIFQLLCYCADCRKASGSAFAEVLLVAADRLTLTAAEPKYHAVKADSGRVMNRGFCEQCGSPILIRKPATPQIAFLQAGSLDDPRVFVPAAAVFAEGAPASAPPPAGIPAFDKGPPADLIGPIVVAHFAKRQ